MEFRNTIKNVFLKKSLLKIFNQAYDEENCLLLWGKRLIKRYFTFIVLKRKSGC